MALFIDSHRVNNQLSFENAQETMCNKIFQYLKDFSLVHIGVSPKPNEDARDGYVRYKKYVEAFVDHRDRLMVVKLANGLIKEFDGQIDNIGPINPEDITDGHEKYVLFLAYDDKDMG